LSADQILRGVGPIRGGVGGQTIARLNEAAFLGENDGLHAIAEPKLGEDVPDVCSGH
jgi:hypothetical protein